MINRRNKRSLSLSYRKITKIRKKSWVKRIWKFNQEIDSCSVKFYYDPDTFGHTPYVVDLDLNLEKHWLTDQHTFKTFERAIRYIKNAILRNCEFGDFTIGLVGNIFINNPIILLQYL